jgi:hypothetical protein
MTDSFLEDYLVRMRMDVRYLLVRELYLVKLDLF